MSATNGGEYRRYCGWRFSTRDIHWPIHMDQRLNDRPPVAKAAQEREREAPPSAPESRAPMFGNQIRFAVDTIRKAIARRKTAAR
jgi:hypothetical protein